MVWFFERNNAITELETRYDNDTFEYILELRVPEAAPEIERLPNAIAFRTRPARH